MKNLDLNSYGVQEMDAKAMEEANGGSWQYVIAAVVYLWENREDIEEGIRKGYAAANRDADKYLH